MTLKGEKDNRLVKNVRTCRMLHIMLHSVFQILHFMSHIIKWRCGKSCKLHPKLFLRIRKKGK